MRLACRELELLLRNDPRAESLVGSRLKADLFYELIHGERGVILQCMGKVVACAFLWPTDYTPMHVCGIHADSVWELGTVYVRKGWTKQGFMELAIATCLTQVPCSVRLVTVTKSPRVAKFVNALGWSNQDTNVWQPVLQYRESNEDPLLQERKIFLSPSMY